MLSTLETPRIHGGGSGIYASSAVETGSKHRHQQQRRAPKPVNTNSEKFESGCFDMAAVLVPPSTNGNVWGREIGITTATSAASSVRKEGSSSQGGTSPPRESEDPTPAESSRSFQAKERAESNASDATEKTAISSSSSFSAHSNSNNNNTERAKEVWQNDERSKHLDKCHEAGYKASFPAVGEEPPTSSQPVLQKKSSEEENTSIGDKKEPSPVVQHVFSTPSPDDAVDDAEKERRKQALALEQQQLILARVKEAREQNSKSRNTGNNQRKHGKRETNQRTKVLHKPQPPKQPPQAPAAEGGSPTPKTKRGPRTKGRLFKRLDDGTLVEDKSHCTKSNNHNKNNRPNDSNNNGNRRNRPRNNHKKPRNKREKEVSGVVNPHWVNEDV